MLLHLYETIHRSLFKLLLKISFWLRSTSKTRAYVKKCNNNIVVVANQLDIRMFVIRDK